MLRRSQNSDIRHKESCHLISVRDAGARRKYRFLGQEVPNPSKLSEMQPPWSIQNQATSELVNEQILTTVVAKLSRLEQWKV